MDKYFTICYSSTATTEKPKTNTKYTKIDDH